jgi:hypothetical protein
VPIDALQAYTQETNGANLQADAAVFELEKNGIAVDFHLSGAMSNRKVAAAATPDNPVSLTVADMFSLMPYENSLVVLNMTGPQLKAVLERAYRNYYYYKYVTGYGGYSYYTTCMLTTDAGNKIVYRDTAPELPNGDNVAALLIGGVPVDFDDAAKTYRVSTVNYLAAGSCNFNNSGVSLWPLNQIANDTQYYVRDAVIDYITAMKIVSPAIEGRLAFANINDLAITEFEAVGVPAQVLMGDEVTLQLRKLITNAGPTAPATVKLTATATAPAGSSVTPATQVLTEKWLGIGEVREVFETFTLNCGAPGEQTFSFSNTIMGHEDDIDPNPANDTLSLEVSVE